MAERLKHSGNRAGMISAAVTSPVLFNGEDTALSKFAHGEGQ